jgi:hypothetical protein
MMPNRLALVALALGASLLANSAPAHACDPAPSHPTEVIADDTPECLLLAAGDGYGGGLVIVQNACEAEVLLRVVSCGKCDSELTVNPGESGPLYVETRGRAQLGKSATIRQTYTWQLGELDGTFETEVNYRDTSGACDTFFGCAQSGAAGSPTGGGAIVLFLLTVLGLVRRAR